MGMAKVGVLDFSARRAVAAAADGRLASREV